MTNNQIHTYTHPSASAKGYGSTQQVDMPVVPPSRLSYAQTCAPSSISRQAQHLNPAIDSGNI